jgi:hypothetical protein
MGCFFRREVRDCANHTTNPFYSEHPLDATTHERHNNLTLVQLVLCASLGDEEGQRVVEWPSICNFILLIHLEIERVEDENTSTSSWIYTEHVTPSWLGFEVSNPLESLLLHWPNTDFN